MEIINSILYISPINSKYKKNFKKKCSNYKYNKKNRNKPNITQNINKDIKAKYTKDLPKNLGTLTTNSHNIYNKLRNKKKN